MRLVQALLGYVDVGILGPAGWARQNVFNLVMQGKLPNGIMDALHGVAAFLFSRIFSPKGTLKLPLLGNNMFWFAMM